jgi:hypothetical protein
VQRCPTGGSLGPESGLWACHRPGRSRPLQCARGDREEDGADQGVADGFVLGGSTCVKVYMDVSFSSFQSNR